MILQIAGESRESKGRKDHHNHKSQQKSSSSMVNMVIELPIDEKQEVTIHHARNPGPNILEENIEDPYLNLDDVAVQAMIYLSLQENSHNNQSNASGSGSQSNHGISLRNHDEALARQYQLLEDWSADASQNVLHEPQSGENTPESSSSTMSGGSSSTDTHEGVTRQDSVNPDDMSYEQLQSLEEEMGSESRGFTDEAISWLQPLEHRIGFLNFFSRKRKCVICQSSYKGKKLMTLPCKHCYHSHCIKRWLKERKACPVCKEEISYLV
ncbi:E3 ubiquitin-protein ligase [Canna indica]|uniref:E3 ubiquitin-protein ligase n=1 Tax=Canna indica TaxID=4628 RepID=A0AAQ3L302_9LILI|nr:E3 ubiquitin-protein ligase [Canna indica]